MVIAVVIMIVLIPIAFRVPPVFVLIPPAMAVFPAVGARLSKLMAPVISLGTLPAMFGNGFMEMMICLDDTLLAIVFCPRGARSKQESARKGNESRNVTKEVHLPPLIFRFIHLPVEKLIGPNDVEYRASSVPLKVCWRKRTYRQF